MTDNSNATGAFGGDIRDEVMMSRVAEGDRDAFVALVRKYQQALLNFFYRMNVYTGDREDLVQETFLRLFNYRARYKPTARFSTFLYLLAHQVRVDYYRKQQRRATLSEALRNEPPPEEPAAGTDEETKDRVNRALNTLTEEMRSVIVMSVYQDLKYAEIADILEIPLGTVKTRMFHALQKLRKVLNEN